MNNKSQKTAIPISDRKDFDHWVRLILNGIFSVDISPIHIEKTKNINAREVCKVGQRMFDNLETSLLQATSATEGYYHSFLVISHQLNKIHLQYFRKGYYPENEYLTFSLGKRLRVWHDIDGIPRKLYVSESMEEMEKILVFSHFIFYQITQIETNLLQIVISKTN